ncbi:MAG: hypothetical protein FWE23_07905 [Chitinivibrionia bacterium]|nr:hypothetical protein [Chitinivibrionia bacterium]
MEKEVNLLDLFIILAKQKVKIVVSGIIIAVAVFVVVSFLPKHFKSEVVFLPRGSSGSGFMGLMGGPSLGSVADIIGENPFSTRQYVEILNSRYIIEAAIERFNLIEYYKEHRNNINPLDRTIRAFRNDLSVSMSEEGGLGITGVLSITLTVSNKDPQRAADIANFMIEKLIERSRDIYAQSFAGAIDFLDRQIEENAQLARQASDALTQFQKEHSIFNMPTQMELTLSTYAANLAEISALEQQIELLRLTRSPTSAEISVLNRRIALLRNQNTQLETGGFGNIFPGITNIINLSDEFTQLSVQARMLEQLEALLMQQRLQTQLRIDRDFSAIYIIDEARAAQWRYRPKRITACIIALVIWYAYLIPSILIKSMLASLSPDDARMQKINEFKSALGFKRRKNK